MKKKLLALALALTMCFGTTITANAAMNISNEMGALNTHNILDKNSSKIPKGTLQYMASKFKIEYTQEDLKALKRSSMQICMRRLTRMSLRHMETTGKLFGITMLPMA